MEIGKDMVSNLKDNDSLDFHFVDRVKAAKKMVLKMAVLYDCNLPQGSFKKASSILTNHRNR